MALETRFDRRMWFSGDRLRQHLEMLHHVAGRWLVTLHTLRRRRGRVLESVNRPALKLMTLHTVATHVAKVGFFKAVTARTVETVGFGGQLAIAQE